MTKTNNVVSCPEAQEIAIFFVLAWTGSRFSARMENAYTGLRFLRVQDDDKQKLFYSRFDVHEFPARRIAFIRIKRTCARRTRSKYKCTLTYLETVLLAVCRGL